MTINGVGGAVGASAAAAGGSVPVGGFAYLSTEGMLMYCSTQLQGLDGEIKMHMGQQQTALKQRQAIQHAQQVIESFGTGGPQNIDDFNKCMKSVDEAMAQLPPGDPARTQLQAFKDKTMEKYTYVPGQPLTPDEQNQLAQAKQLESFGFPLSEVGKALAAPLEAKQAGTFKAPNADHNEWSGQMEELKNLSESVKSTAELDMLQLQDLVSKRQTAVQITTSIMAKLNETANTIAKNV